VVRTPGYPREFSQPLAELEQTDILVPLERVCVKNFKRLQLDQKQTATQVVILEVNR
jgi:hypothetical protein